MPKTTKNSSINPSTVTVGIPTNEEDSSDVDICVELEGRCKAYKFVAYAAIAFSVVAIISVCITLPMVYTYVKYVRRQLHNELDYCKVRKKY
ncbi:hypothetical protein ACQ4LE_009411 [Meloidogyne hapla]